MDNLREYYEAMADQEPGIANPVVGMNCAALFPGLLHVKSICKKVGRFLPAQKLCFLLHWHGRKNSRFNCSGQMNFALGKGTGFM